MCAITVYKPPGKKRESPHVGLKRRCSLLSPHLTVGVVACEILSSAEICRAEKFGPRENRVDVRATVFGCDFGSTSEPRPKLDPMGMWRQKDHRKEGQLLL